MRAFWGISPKREHNVLGTYKYRQPVLVLEENPLYIFSLRWLFCPPIPFCQEFVIQGVGLCPDFLELKYIFFGSRASAAFACRRSSILLVSQAQTCQVDCFSMKSVDFWLLFYMQSTNFCSFTRGLIPESFQRGLEKMSEEIAPALNYLLLSPLHFLVSLIIHVVHLILPLENESSPELCMWAVSDLANRHNQTGHFCGHTDSTLCVH